MIVGFWATLVLADIVVRQSDGSVSSDCRPLRDSSRVRAWQEQTSWRCRHIQLRSNHVATSALPRDLYAAFPFSHFTHDHGRQIHRNMPLNDKWYESCHCIIRYGAGPLADLRDWGGGTVKLRCQATSSIGPSFAAGFFSEQYLLEAFDHSDNADITWFLAHGGPAPEPTVMCLFRGQLSLGISVLIGRYGFKRARPQKSNVFMK